MPRTPGAKNKPKTAEYYLKKAAELSGKGNPSPAQPQAPKKPILAPDLTKSKPSPARFEISKPRIAAPKTKEETPASPDVYRCGNPDCGKVLPGAVSPCPYCRANLDWGKV